MFRRFEARTFRFPHLHSVLSFLQLFPASEPLTRDIPGNRTKRRALAAFTIMYQPGVIPGSR
jgi:hypothetical protein